MIFLFVLAMIVFVLVATVTGAVVHRRKTAGLEHEHRLLLARLSSLFSLVEGGLLEPRSVEAANVLTDLRTALVRSPHTPGQDEADDLPLDATGERTGDRVHAAPPPSDLASNVTALLLRGVTYHYPHSEKVALADVSYTFSPGTTAIVGPNGAGKSTLVKLLTGLLTPTSGAIHAELPDGVCVPAEQLGKAVLFQEPSHLHLTVRQNVTMRYERAPDEDARIHRALDLAGLREAVAGLPDGIDTLVGAGFGGLVDLSGGQWQRLALARLIYQDAPIMILDEPVASLDPEGERAVFELFSKLRDRIIIFTTHRYDSIPQGTPIVVLVDGCVAEAGTHEELLRRERNYWSLYTSTRSIAHGSRPVPAPRLETSGCD